MYPPLISGGWIHARGDRPPPPKATKISPQHELLDLPLDLAHPNLDLGVNACAGPTVDYIQRKPFYYESADRPIDMKKRWLGSRVVSVLDSGADGPGFEWQPQRCRVRVLCKLFTPIVPLFTKQQNW